MLREGLSPRHTRVRQGLGIKLPEDLRIALREALTDLRLQQSTVAEKAHVSPSLLSNLLSGAKPVKEPELVEGVARELLRAMHDSLDHGLVDQATAERIGGRVSELRQAFSIISEKIVAPPGGAIPPSAHNYVVRRDLEQQVLAVLDAEPGYRPAPFTMGIQGPPDCGKTTLLHLLGAKARERGLKVSLFDCRRVRRAGADRAPSPPSDAAKNERLDSEERQRLFELLWDQLELDWAVSADPSRRSDPMSAFTDRLTRALLQAVDEHRLLLLDDLTALGADAAADLFQVIRNFTNRRATESLRISFGTGLTVKDTVQYETVLLSYRVIPHKVYVRWLTRDEVQFLLERTTNKALALQHGQWLWDKFRGQPEISHVAAWLLKRDDPPSQSDIYRWALRGNENFAQHFQVLRDSLLRPAEDRERLRQIINNPERPWLLARRDISFFEKAYLIAAVRKPDVTDESDADDEEGFFECRSPYYREVLELIDRYYADVAANPDLQVVKRADGR